MGDNNTRSAFRLAAGEAVPLPSPFPGMDPYLEKPPSTSCALHDTLVACVQEALQPRLPEPYYAKLGELVWMETSRRHVEPDVNVMWREGRGSGRAESGVATMEPTAPVVVTVKEPFEEPFTEFYLEVYRRQGSEKRPVTSIELLSLANKAKGSRGRQLYLSKQREILDRDVHLIEIDLLAATESPLRRFRGGDAVAQAGSFDYHVSVTRFDRRGTFFVYPIHLGQSLPSIAIPLIPGDPDVTLDLQAAFDHAYVAGPFGREVRYDSDPIIPPLRPDQAEWVAATLEAARREARS